jgi:serine phosphatase RsbU (regulator of sigma subunit)
MGHGVNAGRLSNLAVTAYRNARRKREDMAHQARGIHEALRDVVGDLGFVTGQLLAIDLDDAGRSSIVNAGHPPPLLQRAGAAPQRIPLEVDLPFGISLEHDLRVQPLELTPGDRLVLFSDGVVEARPDDGLPFGEDRLREELHRLRTASPREAARRLIAEVRGHRAGDLIDDATIMVVDVPERRE